MLLQSDWLRGKFGTSQSLSGNVDSIIYIFFLIYVFIFGCLQKEVQSHLVTA